MDREQCIEYVRSQTISTMIELEAMKMENFERKSRGEALAWDHVAFIGLIDKYQLSHNAVITNLYAYNR
jgi:hypothetical protein